jgi:FkbM family methyltransferase
MGLKHSLLIGVNAILPAALSFSSKLPSYYQGHVLWLDRRSWSSAYSRYEPNVAAAIRDNLKKGDVFWDVGANVGWFSLYASRLVGKTGSVASFEPAPDVFSLLQANTRQVANIKTIRVGIGNRNGNATFCAHGASSAASFIREVTEINSSYHANIPIRDIDVSIRTLDSFADLPYPSLLKIDVEGFELEVLRGASDLLMNMHPKLIIEIHPRQLSLSGGTEEELFHRLSRLSYSWTMIDRNPNSLYTIFAQ